MKNRIIITCLITLLSIGLVIGQNTGREKPSFGILGGVNFQNFAGKNNNDNKLENDMILCYHAGLNIQIPIAQDIYFQPGLLFTVKGSENTVLILTSKYNLSYIELPLNLVYKGRLGNGYVMIGFGPYIGYAIMGKANFEGGSVNIETDIEFQNLVESGDPIATTYFKAFDAGGNIFGGYEMADGLFFQLNTQFGMIKINPEDNRYPNDESVVRNTGFGLSLGYRF